MPRAFWVMAVLGLSRRKKKKLKKKTFQSLKKIFALGKKKRKQKQTIENKDQKKKKKKWRVSNMKTNTPFHIIFLKIICSTFKSQTNSSVLKINCL